MAVTKINGVRVLNTRETIVKIIGKAQTVILAYSTNLRVIIGILERVIIIISTFFIFSAFINLNIRIANPNINNNPLAYRVDLKFSSPFIKCGKKRDNKVSNPPVKNAMDK
jgi:hypothetical protein